MNRKVQLHIMRLAAAVLSVLLLLSNAPIARAADASGSCGSGVSWEVSGGTLTISGSGAMEHYQETATAPWKRYQEQISRIVVTEGVTNVGNYAFFEMDAVASVSLADSVTEIGSYAFYDCNAMGTASIGNSIRRIGSGAFYRCRSLKAISLPGTLQIIEDSAFYRCESLRSVVIPASVNTMGPKVFTYCSGLRLAVIRANIMQLPYWTFYGCYDLQSVALSSSITQVDVGAFEQCENLSQVQYGGTGAAADSLQQQIQTAVPGVEDFTPEKPLVTQPETEFTYTVTQENDGKETTQKQQFFTGPDSTVNTQTTQSEDGITVKVEAVLETQKGWEDVDRYVSSAIRETQDSQLQADVYLDDSGVLLGSDLGRFAGKPVNMVIHTLQGTRWHINGKEISAETLKESYDLSYTLQPLNQLTEGQKAAIGAGKAYSIVFHDTVDFTVALELPLGYPYCEASFFMEQKRDAYTSLQKVTIDGAGMAYFYIGYVQGQIPYLIGVKTAGLGNSNADSAIIPDSMQGEHLPVEWIDKTKYIVTDVKSSWGISIGQLTLILVAVIVVSVVVVGVVMRIVTKRKYAPKQKHK